MKNMKPQSSIPIKFSRSYEEEQIHSDSDSLDRRKYDRRGLQHDRRDSMNLHEKVQNDRRRNDRRNLTILRDQSSHFGAELLNAPMDLFCVPGKASDLLRLWIVTEQSDLSCQISQLQVCPEEISFIDISQYSFKEIKYLFDKGGESAPDIILIDMRSSVDKVTEQLHMIRKKLAAIKIILLYDQVLPDFIDEIIEYRVTGLLQAGINYKIFEKAINAIHRGELWLPHHLIQRIFDKFSSRQGSLDPVALMSIALTECEQKVMKLLVLGFSNKQIARQLNVSPETVKKHLKNIFLKTGIHSRSQLIAIYSLGMNYPK